jgi:LytS/YehU family sensor histidine kinase
VETDKLKFELSFLKSQINPHFLFNIINSIYFQIDQTNTIARDSLEKLSNLLRYTLYESDKENVDINNEIEFIKTYFELQKIRIEDCKNINLHIDIKERFLIKPFLILPLIENAFKHYSKQQNGFIEIIIKTINLGKLAVEVKNSFINTSISSENSGVGIQNLKQRLVIFYKNDFDFQINKNEEENVFTATLIIPYEN